MNECDHYKDLEMSGDDGIPDWIDENKHLTDYDYDYLVYCADEHYSDEYVELRAMGLNHKQAMMVIK